MATVYGKYNYKLSTKLLLILNKSQVSARLPRVTVENVLFVCYPTLWNMAHFRLQKALLSSRPVTFKSPVTLIINHKQSSLPASNRGVHHCWPVSSSVILLILLWHHKKAGKFYNNTVCMSELQSFISITVYTWDLDRK